MKNDVVVILTSWEIMLASQAGIMRQVENIKNNRIPAHGAGDFNNWQIHIEGCLGEYVISKFLGIHWAGKGSLRAPDVGEVDVRTASKDNYRLILHKEDPDDRIFWLVCGVNGKYSIKGWIKGIDGKVDQYWQDPKTGRPAYFIPQDKLNSPNSF